MITAGIGTIQDKVPNGGEQPWDDIRYAHGTPEQGVANLTAGDRLGYTLQLVDATFQLQSSDKWCY